MTPKNKLTKNKKTVLLACLGAVGVLFILIGSFAGLPEKNGGDESFSYYTTELEEKIASLCETVAGISHAKVLLTLDGGSEYIYAENEQAAARDYVIITSGKTDSPVLVNEIYPKIRGVAVVCTGGDRADVQVKVTELLSAALGISANRIKVAGGGE